MVGAERLRVTVSASHVPSVVRFEVLDRGPGFKDSELPQIFEPFFAGQGRGKGSLGLGLALVSRIAHAHGGRAFAENRPEGGACVGLELPSTHLPLQG